MFSENPFAEFRSECESVLADAFKKTFPSVIVVSFAFEKPTSFEHGQLASSQCFELAKQIGKKPLELAKLVTKNVDTSRFQLIKQVTPAGAGYINFYADFAKLASIAFESVVKMNAQYGFVKTDKPLKVILEHTSVNPLHPIHIGQARNPVLGDTLSRILKARGYTVTRHYYIDDVGRQSSVIAYGYQKLGKPETEEKPDQFIGRIYTVTSCLVEINRLKRELERAKTVQAEDEIIKINRELDEWVSIAADLKARYPDLFDKLLESVGKEADSEAEISRLNRAYEDDEPKAKKLIREVSEMCLEGFRQTLSRMDVHYDSWDWESEHVWTGQVKKVLQDLQKSPYTFVKDGVTEFDAEKVIQNLDLREKLGLKQDQEVTPLTLVRADGTTLYTTRDVAYTLWKFRRADRVINVIGVEQSLSQLQLKIALYALGFGKYADNLVHFAHNLITLPGYKMSSRRGRYITFDEVMDEAVKRAFEEVSKRSPKLSEQEKHEIAEFVGIGAVRYALVEVDASKPVTFTWDRVLNFEKNSAPYIQYTHARACSILRKADRKPEHPMFDLLKEKLEQQIVLRLAGFPDVFIEACEYLKPNLIAEYANALADEFNTFYNAFRVIGAEPQELSDARLLLTDTVRSVLRNALNLIGVHAPEKM